MLSQIAPLCQVTLDQAILVEASAQYPVFLPTRGLFCHWDWSTAGPYHSRPRPSCRSVLVCLDQQDLLTLSYLVQASYRQDMERGVCENRKVATVCSYRRRLDKGEDSQSLLQEEAGMFCWMGVDSYIGRRQLNLLEAWDLLAC